MPTTSVIVPTYNRPDDLRACVESVLKQTVLPTELLVIDDGNLQTRPLQPECEAAGIRYIYHKKDTPGLTESRNAGIRLSSGDIVFFFDDDCVLLPDYIEETLKPYANDPEQRIGGVGGLVIEEDAVGPLRHVRHWLHILFLAEGIRQGKVLPSGFCTEIGGYGRDPTRVIEVDFLPGGICSYRRCVFDEFLFTERYRSLGFGEDKDFSYRVSRKHKLLVTPHARLYHNYSPEMRPDLYLNGRKFVVGRYLFFKLYVRRGWWSWFFFYYALFGYTLVRTIMTLILCKRREYARLQGILGAGWDAIRGRVSLESASGDREKGS
jgi:glucosyl-dolichyl phosphate glucuronosyltransferase